MAGARGRKGYRNVWAGVVQRGHGHAADGDAQALHRHLLKAALLPRGISVALLILIGGLCPLLVLVL